MLKSGELLRRKIRKYIMPVCALVVLAAITLVVCAAIAGNVVNIYDGENVTNLKTSKLTVAEVLQEAEIIPGQYDKVEPGLDTGVYNNMRIDITRAVPLSVTDGADTQEVFTLSATVEEVLAQCGITYSEFDRITPALQEPVARGMHIVVEHAKNLTFSADAGSIEVTTLSATVGDLLAELNVSLGEYDFTEPTADTALEVGMTVRVVRVQKKTVTEETAIGYKTEERKTSSLTKGNSNTVQNGKNGVKTNVYEVVFHDEVEVSKQLVSSDVTANPVNKIVEIGTAEPKKAVATASGLSYKKMITCTATAYDLSFESCGKRPGDANYGITASGMQAGPGVIAVDPNVIPLGTKLYIEAADGSWSYGYCVAGDTGSGVRGNKVDLFFSTRQESRSFGRRSVNVYIL